MAHTDICFTSLAVGDVNVRTDKWGVLTLFPAAVVHAVRLAIGPDIPLLYRFSIHSDDPAASDNPVTPDSLERLIGALEAEGVDMWDISCFKESRRGYFGTNVFLSDWVKRFSNKPRIVAGNLLTPQEASQYILGGHAEGVALARALIGDAEWANKARSGGADEIRPVSDDHRAQLTAGIDPGIHGGTSDASV